MNICLEGSKRGDLPEKQQEQGRGGGGRKGVSRGT